MDSSEEDNSIATQCKNLAFFHNSMKFSKYVSSTPHDIFFVFSAIADLTFGDLYGYFCPNI